MDAALRPHFDQFAAYYGHPIQNIPGVLKYLGDPEVIGYCYTFADGSRMVEVDSEWWSTATYLEQEALVFHELGHCVLDREHLEGTIKTKRGTTIHISLMNPTIISEWEYRTNRLYYIQELFNPVNRTDNEFLRAKERRIP